MSASIVRREAARVRRHRRRRTGCDKPRLFGLDGWDLGAAMILFVFVAFVILGPVSALAVAPVGGLQRAPNGAMVAATTSEASAASPAPAADPSVQPIFSPTIEWQQVPDGHAIPPGLEVRMDLERGERFARVMPGTSGEAAQQEAEAAAADGRASARMEALVRAEQDRIAQENAEDLAAAEGAARALHEKVAEALRERNARKEGKSDDAASSGSSKEERAMREIRRLMMSLPEPEPEVADAMAHGVEGAELDAVLRRVWDRRQAELKEAFEVAKTEAEQMTSVLARARRETDEATRVALWEELEFLAMSAYNAADLTRMGGVESALEALNETSWAETAIAARLLGTLVKHNPEAQTRAISGGALVLLSRTLRRAASAVVHTPSNPAEDEAGLAAVQGASRAVFALGTLLRNNPAALRVWQPSGVHDALVSLGAAAIQAAAPSNGPAARESHASAPLAPPAQGPPVVSTLPWSRPARALALRCAALLGDVADLVQRPVRGSVPVEATSLSSAPALSPKEMRTALLSRDTCAVLIDTLQLALHTQSGDDVPQAVRALSAARRPCKRRVEGKDGAALSGRARTALTAARTLLLDRQAAANADAAAVPSHQGRRAALDPDAQDPVDAVLDAFEVESAAADAARDVAHVARVLEAFGGPNNA